MRVAIVGCGGLGNVHASSYESMPGVTVVGVYDIVEERALKVGRQTGAKVFSSYKEMLEQSGCEVVSITVPSYLHKQYAIQAAEAGKHVISEKPISLSLEDAREMIETCKSHGVRLFVGHVVRYFPEYAQMKEKINAGAIGRLGVAHMSRVSSHPGHVQDWYFDEEKSGGVILDLMIHDIDFARWVGGNVISVYCQRTVTDQIDFATATLIFDSGAAANLKAQWGYPGPFATAVELAGSDGIIRHDSSRSVSLQVRKQETSSGSGSFVEIPNSPGYESPYYLQLHDFIHAIKEGRESLVTAEDAYKALEIALAVVESARSGNAVVIKGLSGEVE